MSIFRKIINVSCKESSIAQDLISANEATCKAITNYNNVTKKNAIIKEQSENSSQSEHKSR